MPLVASDGPQSFQSPHHFLPLLSLLCVSLVRILVIGFEADPKNLGWLHFKILNFIIWAMTLFPNEIIFTGPRCENVDLSLWRPPLMLGQHE